MTTRPKNSEVEILERYRVALENVETKLEITTIMTEFGYDATGIAEGKALFGQTCQAYDANKTKDDETSAAYADFTNKCNQLEDTYGLHRKKAKVIFKNGTFVAGRMGITGQLKHAYVKWLESVKKFYQTTLEDTEIQNKLLRLKITAEDLAAANTLIVEVEAARAFYLQEKGESQDATQLKDQAFDQLDEWMSEFYAVPHIALEDHPQLLEALSKIVRS